MRTTFHIEAVQKMESEWPRWDLGRAVIHHFNEVLGGRGGGGDCDTEGGVMTLSNESLAERLWKSIENDCDTISHIKSVSVLAQQPSHSLVEGAVTSRGTISAYVFKLYEAGSDSDDLDIDNDEEGDGVSSSVTATTQMFLPNESLVGLWESLYFDGDIKERLLQYVNTTLTYSEKDVDPDLVSWNKVVLLHGPPGTGKTTLCKAFAQKLVIRQSLRYRMGQLVEINSHSLFSRWFSESGKLVLKLFDKIHEMLQDRDTLVCVLIDEVESLTAARKAAFSGSEPSDALRVVNALLTQLDKIRREPNVVILTTSNITGAIDLAFVDRADIKQYIGLPISNTIYQIYASSLNELIKKGIIQSSKLILSYERLKEVNFTLNPETCESVKLWEIAGKSSGLSGRTLRKIPLLGHALFIQTTPVDMSVYLKGLERAVQHQFEEREELSKT